MVKHRYLISFFSTTLFYLLLAGTYFYVQHQNFIADQKPQDQIVHLSLSNCIPEAVPPVEEPEEIEEEEPVVEEEVIEEPEPEPEPIIEEKPIPEKIIPEPIEPKIIPKPVEKKPIVKKKKKVKKKVRKKAPAKTTKGIKRAGSAHNNAAKKNQFLTQVRRKINKHKSYPKIAKRRGMQGKVKVRFTILASGNVGHISIKGPKVFHNSARYAVKSAFPISTRNVPISLPTSVNLVLHYQLK